MMMQTSIHNPSARANNFMTLEGFKKMTKGINNGKDLEDDFIEEIYTTIETDPISLIEDDEARLKKEGTQATSYKRKQDLFIKEGQGLAKRGHELMKEKKKATQFILVNDSQAIGPLYESCWSAMFAVFSVLLEEHDDENIIKLCIDGFMNSIKICGFYGMDTERDAFVGSLANFTGIYKVTNNENILKKELTDKNILCTKALLNLAMLDGNYLASSWASILKAISMINYYHNFVSGSGGYNDFFEENYHGKLDPETEAIRKLNAARISQEIDESDIDKIFSNSVTLDGLSIIDFIKSMCHVSEEELAKTESPRIFLLQKLVEVADINMNRVRAEFSRMWIEIGHHLSKFGCHENSRIAEYSVDSLRQLAKKFLEKDELENFHFQKDFLEPFRTIMMYTYSRQALEEIRHFILSCMCLFAQQRTSGIKSGWEVIIDIFKLGAGDENINLYQESLQTMTFILKEDNFQYIEEWFDKITD
jgi:brefeldin A-inhibited guanine nucleotide-exchange protein